MFDLNTYLDNLIAACKDVFDTRLLYVGLQGSYLRGEATEQSDIDIMLILDGLTAEDMDAYRAILQKNGHFELSCGFICGREEMARWNPLEVCQLLHTTKDLYGTLTDYLPEAMRRDEIDYVKLSLDNLYHALCHRYIHADREKNVRALRKAGKELYFLIQNLHFLETGTFVLSKRELKEQVGDADRAMLNLSELPDGYDFDAAFRQVLAWCQQAFLRIDRIR
ncbi:MAG: nucleotidyltransferase domain-containing protein [Clostridia bacterium]|nr:nucleotidyltransferase domain-containing protein [Clostridia bacterium]